MEAFEAKWLNSKLDIIGISSIKLEVIIQEIRKILKSKDRKSRITLTNPNVKKQRNFIWKCWTNKE